MNSLSRFLRREQEGQAIVLIALVLLVLFMFVGLAVDAGQLYSARRTMQEAADSAAYAGAVVVYQGGTHSPTGSCGSTTTSTTTDGYLAAVNDGTKNGFTDGVSGVVLTINNPPTSGPYCGDGRYFEVTIQTNVRTSLVPAESGLTTVRVRGVAGAEPLNNGYAIMALDPAVNGPLPSGSAFYADDTAYINLTGGGIVVNATGANAAYSKQGNCSQFTIQSPYGVDISGGKIGTWPSCPWPNNFTENTTQPQVPDPFAGYPPPSTSGLPVCTTLSSCQDVNGYQNPGVYKVSIGGAGGTTITLNPGVYILENGINASGNADIVSRNDASCAPTSTCGVFFYNTLTNYAQPGYPTGGSCGPINLAGNAVSTVNALSGRPDTDPLHVYNNFLVYQDSKCTATMSIGGNGSFTGSGTIYLPSAQFVFDGNNATLTGSQLVANDVNLQSGNITINFDGSNTAQPILPRLSE